MHFIVFDNSSDILPKVERLSKEDTDAFNVVNHSLGLQKAFWVSQCTNGRSKINADKMSVAERITFLSSPEGRARRLYHAMMLYDVTVQEKTIAQVLTSNYSDIATKPPIFQVADKYRVDGSVVRQLLTDASIFASCTALFCKEFPQKLWRLHDPFASHHFQHAIIAELGMVVTELVKRLAFGVRVEFVPLMEIRGVKQARARQLFMAGFRKYGVVSMINFVVMYSLAASSRLQKRRPLRFCGRSPIFTMGLPWASSAVRASCLPRSTGRCSTRLKS